MEMPGEDISLEDLRVVVSELLFGLGQRCSTCQLIDFHEITRPLKKASVSNVSIGLGTMAEVVDRKDKCSLCRLVYGVLVRLSRSHNLEPHYQTTDGKARTCSLKTDAGLAYRNAHGELARSERTLKLTFLPEWPQAMVFWHHGEIPLPRIVGEGESEEASLNCARELQTSWVDIELAKGWLKKCESWHDDCNVGAWSEAPERLSKLRIIDTKRKCLVQLPQNCRYVALSYCWGDTQSITLTKDKLTSWETEGAFNPLQSLLPRTLQDAIDLVDRMDEQYLWIDSLCVMQDNAEKLEILGEMHRIYAHAVFTIIAADGSGANSGLPGVCQVERFITQTTAQVTPQIRLAVAWPDLERSLMLSVWNQRGWTYQERLMSRRNLIFLNSQMYWSCHAETWDESRILEHQRHSRWKGKQHRFKWLDIEPQHRSGLENKRTPLFGRRMIRTGRLQIYFSTVEQYSWRKLTFQNDMLNAFAGLSRGHQITMKSPIHLGLPLGFFDMAILWYRTQTPLTRRSHDTHWSQTRPHYTDNWPFPSWSWAGWIGPVRFLDTHVPGSNRDPEEERVRSVVHWYRFVRDNENISRRLDSGMQVPVLDTDRLERIIQAHEDDGNPTEPPPEEAEPYNPVRDWRVMQRGDIEENLLYPGEQMIIALDAAALWQQRCGRRGKVIISPPTDKPLPDAGPNDLHLMLSGEPIEGGNIQDLVQTTTLIRMADGSEISEAELRIETDVFPEALPGEDLDPIRDEVEWLRTHVSKRDFRYLYFRTSCAFFHLGCFINPSDAKDGIIPYFEILHPVTSPPNWPSGETIGWVQLCSGTNPCILNRSIHEFAIISEAHKYAESSHDWALRWCILGGTLGDSDIDWECEKDWTHFKLWNVLLLEWRKGVAYRIGIGRVWKKAWAETTARLKLVTLG